MRAKTVAMLSVAVLVMSSMAFAASVSLEGVKCIIAGGKPANAEKHAAWKDGKVYFCCDNCKGKFESASKEDKEKMAAKANHQLVATKQYEQKACPTSGGKLDSSTAIEVGGTKIAFCCKNCKGDAEKLKGDEQVSKLFGEEAFKKAKFELVKETK
jgi:uncharacterized pyridoxamine 5'-phosphate oxidase family protein